jgi:hypothetical protein
VDVGQIRIAAGVREVELESEHGNAVSAIVKGDMVVVRDAAGAILSGVF